MIVTTPRDFVSILTSVDFISPKAVFSVKTAFINKAVFF